MTYVEIYNERVFDLLAVGGRSRGPETASATAFTVAATEGYQFSGGKPLRVREHPKHGPYVEGAVSEKVTNWQEMASVLRIGADGRTVASTKTNVGSSRSHAIFTVSFSQTTIKRPENGDADTVIATDHTSRISMVDLAGSERASKTGVSEGQRMRESSSINQSF